MVDSDRNNNSSSSEAEHFIELECLKLTDNGFEWKEQARSVYIYFIIVQIYVFIERFVSFSHLLISNCKMMAEDKTEPS